MNQLISEPKKNRDKRAAPRIPIKLDISFEHQNKIIPCETEDISLKGIAIRVNCILVPGDKINILMSEYSLPSAVVRSIGNVVGVRFFELSDQQLSYIKWLSRENQDKTTSKNEVEKAIMKGNKTYILKAEIKKDERVLRLFLISIKKDFKGLADITPLKNGVYQIDIYDVPSFVTTFESLITFWKVNDLIID